MSFISKSAAVASALFATTAIFPAQAEAALSSDFQQVAKIICSTKGSFGFFLTQDAESLGLSNGGQVMINLLADSKNSSRQTEFMGRVNGETVFDTLFSGKGTTQSSYVFDLQPTDTFTLMLRSLGTGAVKFDVDESVRQTSATPIPSSAILLTSALVGYIGLARRPMPRKENSGDSPKPV